MHTYDFTNCTNDKVNHFAEMVLFDSTDLDRFLNLFLMMQRLRNTIHFITNLVIKI